MSLSEFDIIEKYFSNVGPQRNDVSISVGDDCAVLQPLPNHDIVVTVDNLVDGVHFDATTPVESLAYKAVMVSVSDIAAMGANPCWLSLALTLPVPERHWLELFSKGLHAACEQTGVRLVGGNMSRGPLNISTQLTGQLYKGQAVLRSGAGEGDLVYITGRIGEAALGLLLHQKKLPDCTFSAGVREHLLSRWYRPTARMSVGLALPSIASACIDISDGVMADLGHLLSTSGVGASIEINKLPLPEEFFAVAEQVGGWQVPLCGGEDYELCFTTAPKNAQKIKQISESVGVKISQIGAIEKQSGLRLTLNSEAFDLDHSNQGIGFTHFN